MDFTSISKLTKEKLMKILSRIVLATMLLGVVTLAQADDKRKNERDHYEYQHHNWYKNEWRYRHGLSSAPHEQMASHYRKPWPAQPHSGH